MRRIRVLLLPQSRVRGLQPIHGCLELEHASDPREIEAVGEQIALGKSNDQIAAELCLSINTVKSTIRAAYKRIGVTSRSQAVIWAIQHGLAVPGEPDLPSSDEVATM